MKIETQHLEDHQVKLTVEVETDQFEEAKKRAARQLAKKIKIPGFRPGKAPYHMVERHAGEAAILEDAIDLLVQDLYPEIIKESGIRPYGPGRLENVPSMEPPTFEFVVPLESEVELPEYQSIRFPYELEPVTDEDVDRVIDNLRQQQAVLEPVERPAQEGDQVQILLSGIRKEVEEGEEPTLIRERSVPVVINGNNMQEEEWPYEGFSKELIGLSENDEKTLTYTYPKDSGYEALRGKEAEFQVKVENVKTRTLPEVDDEFAQAQGEYENLEALRGEIRERLEENAKQEYDDSYTERIMDTILEGATIKFPPQMLDEEIDSVARQLESRLAYQGMEIETYLKTRQMEMEALHEELRPVAEERLKRFLVLLQIARNEDIQVKTEEVQNETLQALNQYAMSLPPEEQRKRPSDELISSLASNVTADLLIRHTLEYLRSVARGEAETQAEAETAEAEAEVESAETAEAAGSEETEAESESSATVETEGSEEDPDAGTVESEK